jgi:hypothetical protein
MAKEIKMNPNNLGQPRVDIKNTTMVKSEDGNLVFSEGFLLRKASKILTGTSEDALVPIPVVYDVKTGKPLLDMLPFEIKQEYIDFYTEQENSGLKL